MLIAAEHDDDDDDDDALLCVELSPATEYSARVQAMTVNGTGPSSPWKAATTFAHDLDGMNTSSSTDADNSCG